MSVEREKIVVSQGVALVMILSSAAMGIIGIAMLILYIQFSATHMTPVFYSALFCAILDFFAGALCFMGGAVLLKKRFFPLTLASIIFLLGSGIATPIAWILDGRSWFNGLLFGTFQIVVSIIALVFLVKLKTKK